MEKTKETIENTGKEHKKAPHCCEAFGSLSWTRTSDLLINSQLL